MLEMQEPKAGVKSQPQRLVMSTIPHAIAGKHSRQTKAAHAGCLFSSQLSDRGHIVSQEEGRAAGSNSRATDLISMTTPVVLESERGRGSRR